MTSTADTSMEQHNVDILWQCLLSGGLSSMAGLAALLRSPKDLTRRRFWASLLNSGLFGAAIAAGIIWKMGSDQVTLCILVSVLAGLGGMSLIDFTLGAVKLAISRRVENGVK